MFFRFLIFTTFVTVTLSAKTNMFECNKIFEDRKSELILEIDRINDKEDSLQSLKEATNMLLKKKKAKLDIQEKEVNSKLEKISSKEEKIEKMLEENKKLLKEIEKLKLDKISDTYSKMKAKSAANILAELRPKDALKILLNIKAKTLAKIFSKMNPKKASELTLILSK